MLSHSVKKHLNQLQQKKYRKEFNEFIVEGIKGVEEALNSNFEVVMLVVDGSKRDEAEFVKIIESAEQIDVPIEFCGHKDIAAIKTTDTFPGILAVVEQAEINLEDIHTGQIVALDKVNDPGNLGTIIRTADWFGISNIILSEDSVDPYNPKVVRSTMGSIFHLNILRSGDIEKILTQLKEKYEYKLYALDMDGDNISTMKSSEKDIYLFGSESHGIDEKLEKLIDKRYTIPGSGQAESLNLSVAAGILLSRL